MTAKELEKLLEEVTPGPWKTRKPYFNEDVLEIAPCKVRGKARSELGSWAEIATVENEYTDSKRKANARLIALAPTLARRVIAAEKLVEALRESQLQIAYLHERLGEKTRSGNTVCAKNNAALAEWEATQ